MIITKDKFQEITQPMIGLPVSHVWRGFGSALFLEFGKLSKEVHIAKNGKKLISTIGEYTVFAGWGWRIERPQSIHCGSWSTNRIIDNRYPIVKGKKLLVIETEGRLPELVLTFSDKYWIHSFETDEYQPAWYICHKKSNSMNDYVTSHRSKIMLKTVKEKS